MVSVAPDLPLAAKATTRSTIDLRVFGSLTALNARRKRMPSAVERNSLLSAFSSSSFEGSVGSEEIAPSKNDDNGAFNASAIFWRRLALIQFAPFSYFCTC